MAQRGRGVWREFAGFSPASPTLLCCLCAPRPVSLFICLSTTRASRVLWRSASQKLTKLLLNFALGRCGSCDHEFSRASPNRLGVGGLCRAHLSRSSSDSEQK
jgi:hypothetical protein